MDGFCFVLLLRLKNELLEDGVVTCDDGDGNDFAASVALTPALYTEPMAAVVDGVGGVGRGLEDDAGLDFTRCVVFLLVLVTK